MLFSQFWGVACGAALGAARTGAAASHLLAKNSVLESAGLAALPGPGHAEVLASSAPAWAGALFFSLSLGLGAASLCVVWVRVAACLPGRIGRWAPWLVLAAPLAAVVAGDPGLGAALLAIALGTVLLHHLAPLPKPGALGRRLVLVAICAAGLFPWATAEEGPFTRLRDQHLFAGPVGLAVDLFYYRWTLYPAEVLKPLAAQTQPVAWVTEQVPSASKNQFCAAARRRAILCTDTEVGSDFRVELDQGALVLTAGDVHVPWPTDNDEQTRAWAEFSDHRDGARVLRRATGIALFFGCPLGLSWLLASAALGFGAWFPPGWRRCAAAVVVAGSAAALVAAAGLPDAELVRLRNELADSPARAMISAHLDSPRPAARYYAARAARRLGPPAEHLLIDALLDPVINVRYAAAESLGVVGREAARTALDELLRQPEEWYVKERAYAALRRIGWPSQ